MKVNEWEGQAAARDPVYRRELARYLVEHRKLPRSEQPQGPGHVAEFLKGGRHTCGVLLRKGLRAHQILDVTGKDDSVEPGKVVDFSEAFINTLLPQHQIVEALREVDRERERLKATIDVNELWEVVEPEGREWTLTELAELYFAGDPGPHGRAALFRALEGGNAFSRQGQTFTPLKPEKLAEHKAEERRAAQADAWLHQTAAWLLAVAQGQKVMPPPDAQKAVELLAAKVLAGSQHEHAEQANTLAKLAHFHSWQAIFDVLVKLGHWSVDENLELLRYGTPVTFSPETLAEAGRAQWPKRMKSVPRLWLRRVHSFTGKGARHERAISIRRGLFGFSVCVHVASPALLMSRGGQIQQAAAERAASLHLPDRLIPMLPHELTNQAALSEEVLRPSLSVLMRFDRRFNLTAYRFQIRRVRVNCPVSREEAVAHLQRDRGLQRLHALAKHLRQQRRKAGAVVIAEPEIEVRVQQGRITLHQLEANTPAHLIDQELSILASTLAGRLCAERGLPAIYRSEALCPEVLVAPDHYDPVACYRQRRVMPRAVLQTRAAPHHGLAAESYAPITRPFSRYTDLLMHQQIIGSLQDGRGAYSEDELGKAILYTAFARKTAREIESSSQRYWLLRYLEAKAGEDLDAVVLDRIGSGYLVELVQTRLRAFCPAGAEGARAPGARLSVRLVRVSARAGTTRLRLAAPSGAPGQPA